VPERPRVLSVSGRVEVDPVIGPVGGLDDQGVLERAIVLELDAGGLAGAQLEAARLEGELVGAHEERGVGRRFHGRERSLAVDVPRSGARSVGGLVYRVVVAAEGRRGRRERIRRVLRPNQLEEAVEAFEFAAGRLGVPAVGCLVQRAGHLRELLHG